MDQSRRLRRARGRHADADHSGAHGERAALLPVRLLHGRRGLHHALHQLHRGAAPQGVPQGEEQELPEIRQRGRHGPRLFR